MTDLQKLISTRSVELKELMRNFSESGTKYLLLHTPDINGTLRTKLGPFKIATDGEAINPVFYSVTHGDGSPTGDIVFPSPFSNEVNGFPNILGLVDPATLVCHGWKSEFASALTNTFMRDGQKCSLDPRVNLKCMDDNLLSIGIETKCALEYEFGIFHADQNLMREGRYSELVPWGQTLTNYEVVRSGDYQEFATEYMKRLESIGIGISSFTTEYGFGMYEFALTPKSPLEAADDAVRAKLHLKELCAERDLVATFMVRFQPPGKESACGAHQHVSLWKDGKPIVSDGPNRLSTIAKSFLAGMLKRLPETHLYFRPTVNSYRRFDKSAWSPVDCTWGFENRTAAVRAITTPTPSASRFEHRVSGADINPYLTLSAILAAGYDGIQNELSLEPALELDHGNTNRTPLTNTLNASIHAFENSDFCREMFGADFHSHYIASRKAEQKAFEQWQEMHISDFEWQRYFNGT